MRLHEWVAEIHRIAKDPDEARIISFAQYLSDVAQAHAILRAKGYGASGTSIVDVARAVPDAN